MSSQRLEDAFDATTTHVCALVASKVRVRVTQVVETWISVLAPLSERLWPRRTATDNVHFKSLRIFARCPPDFTTIAAPSTVA